MDPPSLTREKKYSQCESFGGQAADLRGWEGTWPLLERCLALVLRSPARPDEGGREADGVFWRRFRAMNCQATIMKSLRDGRTLLVKVENKSHPEIGLFPGRILEILGTCLEAFQPIRRPT
jgi:hypothetical protein